MEKIAQDVGDIQSRLLDHRPVVNAEIRYFVKEFEEKRGNTEGRMLENINKMVLEINEQLQLPDFEAMAQQLSEVKKCLEAANHMTDKVQQRELEAQQHPQLQVNMDRLKEKRTEFLKKQQRLKEEMDEEHDKAVGELTTKYCEMQKELTKFSPF